MTDYVCMYGQYVIDDGSWMGRRWRWYEIVDGGGGGIKYCGLCLYMPSCKFCCWLNGSVYFH
jgi:hypothetical protein